MGEPVGGRPWRAGLGWGLIVAVVVGLSACGAGSEGPVSSSPSGSAKHSPSGEGEVGTGSLDVGDLDVSAAKVHFTGPEKELRARLALHSNGCVAVVIDGVERMPLWPEGTVVAQDPANLARYTVTLPGGRTLAVGATAADSFSARGVIDDGPQPFDGATSPPSSKVGSFLGFCGVRAAPVAFRDASTFTVPPA